MQPHSFTAVSAEAAVAQIRATLGPEAVVLNVRPLPPNGLARLWQKPMIEVIAYKPEPVMAQPEVAESAPLARTLDDFRQQLQEIRQQVENRPAKVELEPPANLPEITAAETTALNSGNWKIGAVLQKSGLLPLHAQRVVDELRARHGETPPEGLAAEISLAQTVLSQFWRPAAPLSANSMHVLIGPAGSGKTTTLCKWLTKTVLMEGQFARVWRLDGSTANMAESLSVYCEILGVPCERNWHRGPEIAEDIGFMDLPGIDWRKPIAIKELGGQLKQLGSPQVHLVLNGAYDTSILQAQARAFAALPIADLIITHLDEESRWGKLWNLALGTNFSIRHFSTGQNIPGDFHEAAPEIIFARQFPCK